MANNTECDQAALMALVNEQAEIVRSVKFAMAAAKRREKEEKRRAKDAKRPVAVVRPLPRGEQDNDLAELYDFYMNDVPP
ncbi:MAG TPA: hypothetical protein VLS45_08490, partial [Methylomicrobium sp.]|nr:hypothetical protein [Methylomicrobium sp.]